MQKVTIDNEDYPILFDLNAIAEIQKRYGSIEKIGEKMQQLEEFRWILWTIISEGIEFDNWKNDKKTTIPTEKQLGMTMKLKDTQNADITKAIIEAFNDSFGKNAFAE